MLRFEFDFLSEVIDDLPEVSEVGINCCPRILFTHLYLDETVQECRCDVPNRHILLVILQEVSRSLQQILCFELKVRIVLYEIIKEVPDKQ